MRTKKAAFFTSAVKPGTRKNPAPEIALADTLAHPAAPASYKTDTCIFKYETRITPGLTFGQKTVNVIQKCKDILKDIHRKEQSFLAGAMAP